MKKILLVTGTRPNFIKAAPLYHRLVQYKQLEIKLCHTGQHFDANMSDIFWSSLELPPPDFDLKVSGKNVAETIGKTMVAVAELIEKNNFDLIVVFGDVNATVAGAVAGAQAGVKVMHVEAGLRSFDKTMPEEVNRLITDQVSDFLMVSEQSGLDNLKREGINQHQIFFVGNIMIESLLRSRKIWENARLNSRLKNVSEGTFILATFHRPENVDEKKKQRNVIETLTTISKKYKIVFPVHPRTEHKLRESGFFQKLERNRNVFLLDPLSYYEFIKLLSKAECVITDSGGVQEETTFLKRPCITFRANTERPVTIQKGTNRLLDLEDSHFFERIMDHIAKVEKTNYEPIPLWDDEVSQRIVDVMLKS